MGRATRDTRLETRSAREKLKSTGTRYWRKISKGLALGYRKGTKVAGTWYARLAMADNRYAVQSLGIADDYEDADGVRVLDYFQAQHAAQSRANQHTQQNAGVVSDSYTVGEAMDDYLRWYGANRKAITETTHAIEAHIRPALGHRLVCELKTKEIRQWLEKLATTPARTRTGIGHPQKVRLSSSDPDVHRRRRATANRILTVLKAALNHAWRDSHVSTDEAWRRVKPFGNVDLPKVRFLTEFESTRLINACDQDFRSLVKGALLTGCRYGELIALRCSDYNRASATLTVRISKSGKPRHVPLTDEGRDLFSRLIVGRHAEQPLFSHSNGEPWGKNHQSRRLQDACQRARISPAVTFHHLRHTYGSFLAMRGVPLQVIAEALGHADTRITHRHYAHLLPSYVASTVRANLPLLGGEFESNVVGLDAG